MIVAGEHSGDILGAGLMNSLKQTYPNAEFSGIGGDRMIAEGFNSLYPMSMLSVFGLFEVIKHLPSLLKVRKQLLQTILKTSPDVFIGIDAPDFNLKLERELHSKGIKTVHYVSPTVWAWREKRIKKLQGSLNALLCIFPFEEQYFAGKNVPAKYIGHPLADKYNDIKNVEVAREKLNLTSDQPVLTLMPGSRLGEISRHTELFLKAASICLKQIPELRIIIPLADNAGKKLVNEIIKNHNIKLDLTILVQPAELAISAADVVLVASGTATLEVMLLKRPMVVGYKLSNATVWVIKTFSLLKIPFVSMPNLIANKELVKEFIQDDVTAENMAKELIGLYFDADKSTAMVNAFDELKTQLTCNANLQAAKVVSDVIEDRFTSHA